MADYETQSEEKSVKGHFLHALRQIENAAVLLEKHDDGTLETVMVTDEFAALMECSVKEAMKLMNGAGFFETTHIEDRLQEKRLLRRRVSADERRELTIRKLTAKAHTVWCNVHYAFIDDFGEHYVYCTYFDVTATKEYENRLRVAYMSLGDSFYQENDKTFSMFRVNLTRDKIEDMQGKDLFASDSMVRPYSEVVRLRSAYYPLPEERERFLETFDRDSLIAGYQKGKAQLSQLLFSRRKSGRLCYVRYEAALTKHPLTGEVIAFITEQKCNTAKVQETVLGKILARQFDMVAYVANGTYGVVAGDSRLIEKGSIFPTARKGGYMDWMENRVLPVLHGDEEEKAAAMKALSLEQIAIQVQKGEPYVVNIACDIEGVTYYKRFDFYLVDSKAEFYILLKSDTTEIQREQLELNRQLGEALEDAKQANVAKTAFLSSMSHEIRTPMNAIIGLDNIALNEQGLPPRVKEYLEKIGASARHLLSLINDILDMSRIESGRMVLKIEEFSFGGMLEQINTMINSQCQDRGLHYDCVIQGKVDECYIGDDMKLKQVLINILGNAVKFTSAPGTVSFHVECTARFENQSTIRFVIKDTGIGMDEEYLPKIFDAFSQEDGTTTNSYGGSGLGMAITKNIVEMMNGTIDVESEKGVGTQFTVTVPLRNTDRTEMAHSVDIRPQDFNVLVIDDDPIACEHAKIVLEEVGISSESALSGAEALEMIRLRHARRETYNLMLVDLKMPGQDGVEVTREIRRILGDNAAIIILTAYSWADVEEEAIKAGVDSFMAKPLFASNVLDAFQQAVQSRRKKEQQEENIVLADLKGCRILLAEDIVINAQIMKHVLKMKEVEADHAENGRIVTEMFSQKPKGYYDAILMDVRMPEMDGLEATRAIRKMKEIGGDEIPIIAMTANAFDEDVQRSLQSGMNAHLSKPVEPEQLYRTLAELIGKMRKHTRDDENLAQGGQEDGGR